ncbi:MAG: hypothetical protein WCP46_06220 [Alphaproteobacteria bacterium]
MKDSTAETLSFICLVTSNLFYVCGELQGQVKNLEKACANNYSSDDITELKECIQKNIEILAIQAFRMTDYKENLIKEYICNIGDNLITMH